MDDDIDRKPQTEKVVVERSGNGTMGWVVALIIIGVIILLALMAGGLFGGGGTDTTVPTDVDVNAPTETTPTVPTPNEGQ